MPHQIEISDQSIRIDGKLTPLSDVLHAEASIIEDWIRVAVILAVALVAPILVMVAITLADGSAQLGLWFGPITFVITAILGLIGCAIGAAWKKPWGVIIERVEFGHSTLLRCDSADEAESLAERIRATISKA
ncbi:MAG: hypothetical protein EA402_07155 [Planctomycetota bacterium]|nr:MAG: hypothetical protein EA402_07155 [Planctomycetota bacterium]